MLSFDLVSLFTSVRIDRVVALIKERFSSDDVLPTHTPLSIADIKIGLEICHNFAVFSYQNALYRQMFSSFIFTVVANIFKEHIESTTFAMFYTPPMTSFVC